MLSLVLVGLVGVSVQAGDPVSSDNATVSLEVNVVAPSPPGIGGGGGGYYYYTKTNYCGITGTFPIDGNGKVITTQTAGCKGGDLTVTIKRKTIALDENGYRLRSLTIEQNTDPPDLPEGNFIGFPYSLSPSDATFDPPLIFTWTFDPDDLPEGVAPSDLTIIYFDGDEWVTLTGVVDTVNNTVTAEVSHFTTFALMSPAVEVEVKAAPPPPPPPAPAAFSVTNLSVEPAQVQSNETVTITVSVANTGGTEGSYSVVLKMDGVKEAEKSVTVAAGSSEIVTFSVTREGAGSYSVAVDGLSGSLTVVAPAPTAPPTEPFNWYIIGGIIGGVIIVGILIFFLVVRRRASSQLPG